MKTVQLTTRELAILILFIVLAGCATRQPSFEQRLAIAIEREAKVDYFDDAR